MDVLYASIHNHISENNHSDIDRQHFMLRQIRLCFTRFNKEKNDQKNGEDYCNQMLGENLPEIMRLRVLFYQIKLVPSNSLIYGRDESWPKTAIEINLRYKDLITSIEQEDLADNDVKELYREVLNDYAGSFLTDKILSLFDPQNDKSKEEKVSEFLKALGKSSADELFAEINALLTRRVFMELDEIQQADTAFSNKVLIELLHNPDPSIDKRGLCYTINYFSRACRLVSDEKLALTMAEISVAFNKSVGDKTGACIASGTAGYSCMALGKDEEAYMWFRNSFGFGWYINHFSRFSMVMHMMMMARKLNNQKLINEALFYVNQLELLTAYPYFVNSSYNTDDYALLLLRTSDQLGKVFGGHNVVQLGEYFEIGSLDFLKKAHEILRQLSILKEQTGELSFVWNKNNVSKNIIWSRKVWNEKPTYFNSFEWTLQAKGELINITLKAESEQGSDDWHISQMFVSNAKA
jgi:hypothetical protein